MHLLASILLVVFPLSFALSDPFLRVAAWNLKRFGLAKMSKKENVELLLQILPRYDIVVIMEVVDSSGAALEDLKAKMNQQHGSDVYKMEVSPRLGRTIYREEYAFLYRSDKVEVTGAHLYSDPKDVFQFEPYTVSFTSKSGDFPSFSMMPLHAKPSEAETEVSALVEVYEDFVSKTGIEDVMMLGDFNAGCTYVTSKEWPKVLLKHDKQKRFQWLIDDHSDTTTSPYNNCPYDRIVVAGKTLQAAIRPESARAYFFEEELGLSIDQAESLTDHYPVEVQLQGKSFNNLQKISMTRRIQVVNKVGEEHLDSAKIKDGKDQVTLGSWAVSKPGQVEQVLLRLQKSHGFAITDTQLQALLLKAKMECDEGATVSSVQSHCSISEKVCTTEVVSNTHLQ